MKIKKTKNKNKNNAAFSGINRENKEIPVREASDEQNRSSAKVDLNTPYMTVNHDDPADAFQAVLYNAGKDLLSGFEKNGLNGSESFGSAAAKLQELRNFQYNISFAGEQSSGKSTLINALLEYPLMPTCKLTTTCVGTKITYGEKPRVVVVDDDTKKRVLDVDCTNISEKHFLKLKEYACVASNAKIIENLQHFTKHNLFEDNNLSPHELIMSEDEPNHVLLLMMILLTVYVSQNSGDGQRTAEDRRAIEKRNEVLKFFKFPKNTINYTISLQWNGDFVKNGMTVTDLPGFGSTAADKEVEGRVLKGHDDISTSALETTDAMVFLIEPELRKAGTNAIETMLSNASLKEIINKDDIIIPVLNKIDTCSGPAELQKSIDGFWSLLKSSGVNKKREDIRLCSSWYGESAYKGIDIANTCFYKREFKNAYSAARNMAEMFDMSLDEDAIIEMVRKNLSKKLGENYTENSYIEELKEFFRSSYVSKGKYYKAYATVLEIINLASKTLKPMHVTADNYNALGNLQGTTIRDISKKLRDAAKNPISKIIRGLPTTEDDEEIAAKVRGKLDVIPGKYSAAFNAALKDYKATNLEIVKRFRLAWNSARIDVVPSDNYSVYQALLASINTINVNIKDINKAYADILSSVRDEIDKRYNSAMNDLRSLKSSFSREMTASVDALKRNGIVDESTLDAINSLKNSVVQYVEQQIELAENNSEMSKDNIDAVGKEVANVIIQINTNSVNLYKSSVMREVKDSRKSGFIFKSRDYIPVDGNGGLKQLFTNLTLSSSDRVAIQNNINAVGLSRIYNNINVWYSNAATNIRTIFTALDDEISRLLDETVESLSGSAEENHNRYNETVILINICRKLLAEFRNEIQPMFDFSLKNTNEKSLVKYEGDIFKGIL